MRIRFDRMVPPVARMAPVRRDAARIILVVWPVARGTEIHLQRIETIAGKRGRGMDRAD